MMSFSLSLKLEARVIHNFFLYPSYQIHATLLQCHGFCGFGGGSGGTMTSIRFSISLLYHFYLPPLPSYSSGLFPFSLFFFFFFVFFWPHVWHMEVPRLAVELELRLLAYTTATATPNPSRICELHGSLQEHWILNPLKEARDWTYVLMDTSWVLN